MFKCPNCENIVFESDMWCDSCGLSLEIFSDTYKKAQRGDSEAQMYLGVYYRQGTYVEYNPKMGFYWTEKAAKRGNTPAKYALACVYLDGCGVEQNLIRAVYWLLEARKEGYTEAANTLRELGIADGYYFDEDNPLSITKL